MILLYLENIPDFMSISKQAPLPALESQALEVFKKINTSENTVLGLVAENNTEEIQITSFNQFLWEVQYQNLKTGESRKGFYSTQKVTKVIENFFKGLLLI